jgi:hypothetical protein
VSGETSTNPLAKEITIVKKILAAVAVALCLMTASLITKAQGNGASNNGISGKWHFVLDTPGGDREVDAEFAVDGDGKVTGTFGKTSAIGTYKDGQMSLDFEMTSEESGETAHMKLLGKLDDSANLIGDWQFSSYDGTFKAFRPKK